jgi:hypothetical protein
MDSAKKLYLAIAVLAALGLGLFFQNKKEKQEAKSYSYEAKVADLPKLEISADTKKAIDRIQLVVPKEDKKGEGEDDNADTTGDTKPDEFVLVKKGEEDWVLEGTNAHKANSTNVQSLLDNLEKLKVVETISTSTDAYDRWGVTPEKALHVVAKKGSETVVDLYFGEDGTRGQMARIAGKDGVYAVKGYSKFNYARDLKGWREKSIFKFDDAKAESVVVTNENGEFSFTKKDGKWLGTVKPAGAKAPVDIERFKDTKVTDMLRAYKGLNATDFGDDKQPSAVRLDQPVAKVTIKLADNGGSYELLVGDNAEGNTRYVKTSDNAQIFTVSSWASDWATANVDKFQEKDESKKDDAKDSTDAKAASPKPEEKKPTAKPAAPKPAP